MTRLVDPAFGMRLRQMREARGLSLRELAHAAYLSKSQISEYETGRRRPSADMADCLDRALDAHGQLAALVAEFHHDPETVDQVAHALDAPTRLDASTVNALQSVLAQQRHLDDSLPAAMLLPSVESHLAMVQKLAHEARGPHARAVQLVAIEWCQFAGWMNAQVRYDARGAELLTIAAEDALRLDAPDVASQSHNFHGYIERRRRNPRGIVRWFTRAYETPGASQLHRIDATVQAVHGLALLGDRTGARELLATADDLTTSAEGQPATNGSPAAYWLTASWLRLPIGLAYLGLGSHALAAENLRAGLSQLPDGWQHADWSAEYRQALDTAETYAN